MVSEWKLLKSKWFDIVNTHIFPIFEGLSVSLCFVIGIEVLASGFGIAIITVDFEVGNCVHLIDVKNTVNETRR